MFFPKLRRRAKWVFLFLAIAFGGSFIFFGVGAGGSGIGDYISDLLNRPVNSDTPALDDAQEAVAERPNDPEAQLDLARAAQTEGNLDLAVTAYEEYRTMRPEDADALRTLAALYGTQIAEAQQRADDRLQRGGRGFAPEHARASGQRVPPGADDEPADGLPQRPGGSARDRRELRGAEPLSGSARRLHRAHRARDGRPAPLPSVRERRPDRPGLRDGDNRVRALPRAPAQRRQLRAGSGADRPAEGDLRAPPPAATLRAGRTAARTASRAVNVRRLGRKGS